MNIALIGYGKMGHEVESIALLRGHTIIGIFSQNSPLPPAFSDYYLSRKIECCIDFSASGSVLHHADICSAMGIPLIEGTTGWNGQKGEVIDRVRQRNGSMIYGNNFSVGAHMFFNIVRQAAVLMDAFPEYDVAIHEIHHTKKKDAPSGTALNLADILLSHIQRKNGTKDPADTAPIQPNEVNISSMRIGNVTGSHSVLFHSAADEIEVIHRAHNRSGFAFGAVLAAELSKEFAGVFPFEELVLKRSLTHQS